VNNVPISYDANFNQTSSYHGYSFAYNAQNQVVAGSIQATYDGLGRCVRRTVGGNTMVFTYDGWNPIIEWDGGGNLKGWTIYGAKSDEVLLRYDAASGPLIYKHDNQGSVTFLLDSGGRMVEKYSTTCMGGDGDQLGLQHRNVESAQRPEQLRKPFYVYQPRMVGRRAIVRLPKPPVRS
jgi:hypothetical protein